MAFIASSKPGDIYMVSCWRATAFALQKATVLLEPAFCLNSSTEYPFQLNLFLTSVKSLTY